MKNICIAMLLLPLCTSAGEVLFKNDFKRSAAGWSIPSYYNGKMTIVKDGGRQDGCLKLTAAAGRKKGVWARTYRSVRVKNNALLKGKVIRMSGYVRGKGVFVPGFAMTINYPDKKPGYRYNGHNTIKLTPEWQYFEHFVSCGNENISALQARLDIPGPGEAYIDDLTVEYVRPGTGTITAVPAKVKGKAAAMPEITFSTGRSGDVLFLVLSDAKRQKILQEKLMTNKAGKCGFTPPASLSAGIFRVEVFCKGISASAEIEVVK